MTISCVLTYYYGQPLEMYQTDEYEVIIKIELTKGIMLSYEASDDGKYRHCQAEPGENLYERRRIVFGNDEPSHGRTCGNAAGEVLDKVKD